MNVKIEQDGKKKTYHLINSWSEVTLEKWIQLNRIDKSMKGKDAEDTLRSLTNIPKEVLKKIDLKDIVGILGMVAALQAKQDKTLKHIIEIDGIEYGFHPDLDSITLGEFADIEELAKGGAEAKLPEIMAILYRPITEKVGDLYKIDSYDGDIRLRAETMLKMKAEQVESALVFFWNLAKLFIKITPSYLITTLTETMTQSQQKVSQTNGDGLE